MKKKYDYYSVSLPRELQRRIQRLFEEFPEVENEFKKGENPGYVKFIEAAIREYIRNKEEFSLEKLKRKGKNQKE
ncbi:MAG: hypothetical protein ACFFB5_16750 [Promethearchaeota archaeon]